MLDLRLKYTSKEMLLEIPKNSKENTSAGLFFIIVESQCTKLM